MAKSLIEPKILKGFQDTLPDTGIPRRRMIRTIEEVFAAYGFAALAALGKGLLIVDARQDLDRLHLLADPDDES